MLKPALRPSKPEFGFGWAVTFALLAIVGSVLWAGIGITWIDQLRGSLGSNTRWVLVAAAVFAFLFVPLMTARTFGATSFRAFQISSLVFVLAATSGAIVLRRDAFLDTARSGVRAWLNEAAPQNPIAGVTPPTVTPSKTPNPDLVISIAPASAVASTTPSEWTYRDALRVYLFGDYLGYEGVIAVAPQFAESMTRASARMIADRSLLEMKLSTNMTAMLYQGALEDAHSREVLVQKLADLERTIPTMDDRAALNASRELQALLVRHYQQLKRPDQQFSEEQVRAQAVEDAAQAKCEEHESSVDCFVGEAIIGLQLVREDGVWRVNSALKDGPYRPAGPVIIDSHPPDCAQVELEGACLKTALDELSACVDPKEKGTGHWDHRELGLDQATCSFPDGASLAWSNDERMRGRSHLSATFTRDGKTCGTLSHYSVGPKPKPGHRSNGGVVIDQWELTTRSGTVTLRSPGVVGSVDSEGVCSGGCVRTLSCPDGTSHQVSSSACADQWRVIGSSAAGPLFRLTRYGQSTDFVSCSTPNTLDSVVPPTPIDTGADPLPPTLRQ